MIKFLFAYFIMSFFVGSLAAAQGLAGNANAIGQAQAGTANSAAENFDEAEKRDRECEKLDKEAKREGAKERSSQGAARAQASHQRQKKERDKKECEAKSAAKKGQGMGNLGQLPLQQMAQDQSKDPSEQTPEDQEFGHKLAAIVEGDPMDAYRDPMFGKELLTKSGLSPVQAEKVLSQFAKAEAQGIQLNPETQEVQTPFGSISAAALSSPSGMKAMGFSNEEIQAEVQKQQKDLANLYQKVALASGESGGGGGRGRGAHIDDEFDLPDIPTFGVNSLDKEIREGKRGYFQLTRNIAGGRIGVASDDIFRMVTRRYRKKASVNHFLP